MIKINIVRERKEGNKCFRSKLATKDITVYKIILMDNHSYYREFPYSPNTLYESKLNQDMATTQKMQIYYTGKSTIREHYEHYNVFDGLHSFNSIKTAMAEHCQLFRSAKVVKFTIPKGARYFIGTNDDYVSNKIISGDLKSLTNW